MQMDGGKSKTIPILRIISSVGHDFRGGNNFSFEFFAQLGRLELCLR